MIGLFGGSFDPIHHGHLVVARTVLERLQLTAVRFMPARSQPLKSGHGATPEQRARLVSLAIAGAPGFALETGELERPGPSYTVETLRELHRRQPGQTFALLIGADAAADLPRWREADRLPELARLVVFARPGVSIPTLPWPVHTVAVPAIDISATEIRRRVQAGLPIRYWVPDQVAEAIRVERLYSSDA
jgi:nicotinate-nucleotide adenylyltransferase